jgi:hypothetical protein
VGAAITKVALVHAASLRPREPPGADRAVPRRVRGLDGADPQPIGRARAGIAVPGMTKEIRPGWPRRAAAKCRSHNAPADPSRPHNLHRQRKDLQRPRRHCQYGSEGRPPYGAAVDLFESLARILRPRPGAGRIPGG